jgi:hypothetical protein
VDGVRCAISWVLTAMAGIVGGALTRAACQSWAGKELRIAAFFQSLNNHEVLPQCSDTITPMQGVEVVEGRIADSSVIVLY